ncbi:LysR substrate-binding domain-containing protein [Pelagibius sp. CAU 1746]|uniref:LysR family transcriptional regulator n=1 Tax=Pelagibius sp. CAU 1746 TaxID=3140370 RepID=UPI00325A78DE
MTLEQLRIFVAVADTLHMTRAARELNLTQSAVSAAVAALENRHGVRLFHRIGRRIELTQAGKLLLSEARAVLARAAAAERALIEHSELQRGSLAIHASQTIANYWLPPILHRYRQRYPKIAASLTIGNSRQVAEQVIEGGADLGFVEGPIDEPALADRPLAGDTLTLVVGTGHPWARLDRLDPARLTESDWTLREPGSGTRAEFDSALRSLGFGVDRLPVTLELPSNEAVRAAVEGGAGATAISRLVAQASLRSGALHELDFPFPSRPFHLLWHRERSRSHATEAFIAMLPEASGSA